MPKKKNIKDIYIQEPYAILSDFAHEREAPHDEDEKLKLTIKDLKSKKNDINKKLLRLESTLFYRSLLKGGRDTSEILKYVEQDQQMLEQATEFKKSFNGMRNTFFGYPGNLNSDSPIVRRLRKIEAELFYINNCGDPYEEGNSSMSGKEFEREVLKLFYQKFGIDKDKGWGYVTSGGSESNMWGILNGFRKFPDGRLYFCEAAHYSVEKTVTNGDVGIYQYKIISQTSNVSEKINKQELMESVRHNYVSNNEPAILLLTWGTTKFGSIDDIEEITYELNREMIPYYLHVDAAFWGGIPSNQIDAPICPSLEKLGADSVSVSFHKFFGVPNINSIVVAKDKALGKEISYLGQRDTTISGSRTFPVLSALQRMKEILERSPNDYYIKNVNYFNDLMKQNNIEYLREEKSNIFVIPCPSDDILKKFQLPSFNGVDCTTNHLAHIIINPFHSKDEIDHIFLSIKADQELYKRVLFKNKVN